MLFEKAQFQRLLRLDFFQITRLTPQIFDFIGCGRTGRITSQSALPSLNKVLQPPVVYDLRDALTTAQFGDAVLATQAILHDADILFCGILFAYCPFDIFDDLLTSEVVPENWTVI